MPEISPSPDRDAYWWHEPSRVKKCIRCGEAKALGEFYAYPYTTNQGKRRTRYESRCKDCAKERRKERSRANPGMDAAIGRRRRQEKAEYYPAYRREKQKLPEVKAQKAFLQRIRKARMRAQTPAGDSGPIKAIYAEAARVEKIVACCPVFDLPELGKKMHVDHIMPLIKGGKHEASNLQILPGILNMRKGSKCPR